MAKFVLEIALGNDAMRSPYDVSLALTKLAARMLETNAYEHRIRDVNGNTVGQCGKGGSDE